MILNHAGSFDSIRKTIAHVARQTAVEELELIVVCEKGRAGTVDAAALTGIPIWQVVEVEGLAYGAIGWAAGIHAARGKAVVMAEDHSFPAANWAEMLMARQREGYAVIAPAVENGNPGTAVSWANFQLTFIEWFRPGGSGEVRRGPGHNSCYDRGKLLAMGGEMSKWLVSEGFLQDEMQRRGHRVYLEAATRTRHVNISLLRGLWGHSYLGGRIFGGFRAANWPFWKKLIYAGGFWLVPWLRLLRLFQMLATPEQRREARLWTALPLTLSALYCHAFGEAVGTLAGPGEAMLSYQAFETRRLDFVVESEKKLLLDWQGTA